MIDIIPTDGLANRMRVIASVYHYVGDTQSIRVYWEKNIGLNADYIDLFEPMPQISVRPLPARYGFLKLASRPELHLSGMKKPWLKLLGFDHIFFEKEVVELLWTGKFDLRPVIEKKENLFFHTCQDFGSASKDYTIFKPVPAIQEQINRSSAAFDKHTVGIHIRSTDHALSIENSPFAIFIEKMDQLLCEEPGLNFYLSTDNPEYQQTLLERFGRNKILYHEKEFRRDTKKGIEDAVVDLYCLSRTNKIFGSFWSSFSEIAARIGGIGLEIIKK